jgi:sugar lactone lactonase YvrE
MKTFAAPILIIAALGLPDLVLGQPVVRDTASSIYAVITDPVRMAFAPDGTLFVGRDAGGSGGGSGDAVKIHRVGPGGSPVTEYGTLAISDPDALIVDAVGAVSGTPGAVLVGGVHPGGTTGKIVRIAPDGTVTTLFGPSTNILNPSHFIFDSAGRLLFTENNNGKMMVTTGGAPTNLFSLAGAMFIVEDAVGRLVASSSSDTTLRLYSSNGALLNGNFASAKTASPLVRGPGGIWGTDLYAVAANGDLLRVDLLGTATNRVGSGFANISDLQFGPDGALYASEFSTDRIYRFAQPTVVGAQTTLYARVTDPIKLSFAPDGTLFVGRDNAGSGGNNWDAVRIHRIAPGGSPITEYGNDAITDPDAVFFDAAGLVSGVPGAVIIGGVTGSGSVQGRLSRILPEGTVTTLFGPSSVMINPSDFVCDSSGRLLFTDYEGGKVWVMTNGTPTVLVSGLTQPVPIAVDSQDRILVNATTESKVRLYSPAGVLLTNSFVLAETRTPLALGPGGFWGTGVYYVNTNGDLMTVDLVGQATKVGISFSGLDDIAFGPDGALYGSHFGNDLIWRIAPEKPLLSIFLTTTNTVAVSWPSPSTGWDLQQNTNSVSSLNWSNVTATIQDDGTSKTLIVNPPTGNRFYRLRGP